MQSQSFDNMTIWSGINRSVLIISWRPVLGQHMKHVEIHGKLSVCPLKSQHHFTAQVFSCCIHLHMIQTLTILFVQHGSLALLQDVQMAVVNQGWSFIKFNRVFMLFAYVWMPVVFFQLSGCACSVFHHALIQANLFHNLLCSVPHVFHVFFLIYYLFIYF